MLKPNRTLKNVAPDASRKQVLSSSDNQIGVDREKRIIYGRVVAELGPFKSPGRGEFTMESLQKIVELGNAEPGGLRSRFKHPSASDDGLGKYLGRDKNFRLDGTKVRADFHIAKIAMKSPPEGGGTPYGEYVMELANNDPGALSSSLVLTYKSEYRLNEDGTRQKDATGNPLPPVWMPSKLYAIDVVDTGDAVNDFLSADNLSDNDQLVRTVAGALEGYFELESMDRAAMAARIDGFKEKFLAYHFGENEMSEDLKPVLEGQQKIAESLNTLSSAFAELPGKLAAALSASAPKKDEGKDESKTQTGELSDADRTKKIVALCKAQNKSDLALGFIEEGLSIDQVKDKLLAASAGERQLSGNPTGDQGEGKTKQGKLEAQIESEWNEGSEVYAKMGIDKAKFVKARRVELGLDPETAPMLMKNGVHAPVEYGSAAAE
jgi:hypothetical protein